MISGYTQFYLPFQLNALPKVNFSFSLIPSMPLIHFHDCRSRIELLVKAVQPVHIAFRLRTYSPELESYFPVQYALLKV